MSVTDELALLEAQQDIHELIARQAPLEETLAAIAESMGLRLPGALVSIMRFDAEALTLSMVPCRHFSQHYTALLQNIIVGADLCTCGAAAHFRRLVITEDILSDPSWEAFREAAVTEKLRACWSVPILSTEQELLGTFATYYRHATYPTPTVQATLQRGAALVALAILRDRDSRHHRTLAEWHRSLFVNHPNGVYELDLEGRFQRGNGALERITGYPEQALVGRHFNEFVAPDSWELTQTAFETAKAGVSHQYETPGVNADGQPYHLEITNFPVTIDGEIVGVYGICHDITQRKRQETQIAYQATHDLLTGLPNRMALADRLEHDFLSSQQNQNLLAVLSINLDGFKVINDGLGYSVGNQLLVAVADRLCQLLSHTDTLARLTGDEFVLLLPNVTSREEVAITAERILAAFDHSFEIDGRTLHISTRIGAACSDEGLYQAHELLQHADLAVEIAKQQGRNIWQWYQGQGKQYNSEHVLLRHDLHTALRDNQFELYYQPIVDAVSGQMRSVEALVRWHHPTHGIVSPGIFIPIAEQTGQIIPLGRWVLRQACQQMADMCARGQRVLPVAVNISSLQFRRDGFLDEVQDILVETGLAPGLLELEMTESILLDRAERAIEMIGTLREMGIMVAIDDFGTGFSSLSYLRDLPIHKVKLDRAFIQDILTSRRNAAIVQGIITMAHHMDLVVVAEGIETTDQQQDLIHRGCDMLQGFLFSRPVHLDNLIALPERLPAND